MKKSRTLKTIGFIIISLVCFFAVINLIPPSTVMDNNPFISTTGKPMNCAHRGGGISNPENTMKAFKASVNEFDVDILETDLWMTKDGHLIVSHDGSANRTSDCEEYYNSKDEFLYSEHTLEEIKKLNFGAKFMNEFGDMPYARIVNNDTINRENIISENNLAILEAKDLFNEFYTSDQDLLYIVEIKNSNELGYKAADILNNLLTNEYKKLKNKVVIGTFNPEIEEYLREKCPELLRGASTNVATKFIVTQLLKVNLFDTDNFACLQLPPSESAGPITLNLEKSTYIKRAHKRNIAVQYWTINDSDEMRYLIDLDVDAIMTDNPKLLNQILNEK